MIGPETQRLLDAAAALGVPLHCLSIVGREVVLAPAFRKALSIELDHELAELLAGEQ